jgi:sarcosine oxidase
VRADAVVVGAGVAGTAAARSLAERGLETILLEQFELGHARGSSHGATRIFRLAYPEPDYVRLAQRALVCWRELEGAAGERLLVTTGALHTDGWGDACASALDACGVPFERLTAAAAADRFPMIAFDGLESAVWEPSGAVCLAGPTVLAQARLARAAGAQVHEGEAVVRLAQRGDGIEVETDARSIVADVAVLAAGSYAVPLLDQVGISLPLRPAFAQVSYFLSTDPDAEPPPILIEDTPDSTALARGGYWLPTPGTHEVKAAKGVPGRTVDPREAPFPIDPSVQAQDTTWVAGRLRGYDPEPVRTDTCIYTMTADEDFVLDRVGPIVIGSACSGHGFKFGPLIGALLADLAADGDPGIACQRFSAARFL